MLRHKFKYPFYPAFPPQYESQTECKSIPSEPNYRTNESHANTWLNVVPFVIADRITRLGVIHHVYRAHR